MFENFLTDFTAQVLNVVTTVAVPVLAAMSIAYLRRKRLAKPHVRSTAPMVDYGGSWRCGLVRGLAERSRDQL